MVAYIFEYIWVGGNNELRSKTKVVKTTFDSDETNDMYGSKMVNGPGRCTHGECFLSSSGKLHGKNSNIEQCRTHILLISKTKQSYFTFHLNI